MSKKDLFHEEVEGRMEKLKQQPIKKENATTGERINKIFTTLFGLVIIVGLLFTPLGLLRSLWKFYV